MRIWFGGFIYQHRDGITEQGLGIRGWGLEIGIFFMGFVRPEHIWPQR